MESLFAPFSGQSSVSLMVFALLLDALLGDPIYRLHPIRLIGNLLTFFENRLRALGWEAQGGGLLLFLLLNLTTLLVIEGLFGLFNQLHWCLGWLWHLYIAYSMVALKDLCFHGKRVAEATFYENLAHARQQAGRMVGRDTASLDFAGCHRAVIESLSENLADGVIAPLFYLLLFGIPGMVFYKVVNTLDSMVGYQNEKYQQFGAFSARLDDCLNWIPARLTWLLISGAALILPNLSAKKAFHLGLSQNTLLPSPNAGWPQAAAAGALQLKLVGPLWRNGKLAHDHWVGAPQDREGATPEDIAQMIKLAIGSTILFAGGVYLISLFWLN